MIKRYITFVISFLSVVNIYAQEGDTIRTKRSELPKRLLPTDSLIQDKQNRPLNSALSDYRSMDNNLFSLSKEDNITLNWGISKKKTFFNSSYSKFIIPTALISYGVIARGNNSLLNLDHSTHNEIKEHISQHLPYDDYTQFAPAVAVYGLDLAGIKAKHNFRDRTLIMATSYLVMGVTVQTMKTSFGVERPDGSNNASFPSGRTATAFVGAHILFKEYKDVSPWIGVGGYAVATATGTMRMLNKKHWASDIVAGAGVGILSAEVGYLLLPVWHNILGIKDKDKSLVIKPMATAKGAGVGLSYTF